MRSESWWKLYFSLVGLICILLIALIYVMSTSRDNIRRLDQCEVELKKYQKLSGIPTGQDKPPRRKSWE